MKEEIERKDSENICTSRLLFLYAKLVRTNPLHMPREGKSYFIWVRLEGCKSIAPPITDPKPAERKRGEISEAMIP